MPIIGTTLIVIHFLSCLLTSNFLHAQSRDIRTHSDYGADEGDLRMKYEFYHDMWSERDVKHGRYCEWLAHDRLRCAGYYFDGQQDSIWQTWYRSGNPRETIWWEQGQRHGKALSYDRKGRLREETQFSHGKRQGLSTAYFPNGKVKFIAQYHANMRHGNLTTYTAKGVRKRVTSYAEGKKVPQPKEDPAHNRARPRTSGKQAGQQQPGQQEHPANTPKSPKPLMEGKKTPSSARDSQKPSDSRKIRKQQPADNRP